MINLSLLFKKSVLLILVTALTLAALPVNNAYASELSDPADLPGDMTQPSDECLEQIWARMHSIYERQGRILKRAGRMVERGQTLIERMEENGKDVAALQAALEAFDEALKEAHPVYESAKGLLNSHRGFDTAGQVTDHEKAVETVKALGDKLKEVREITGGPGKALREAIKTLRDAQRSTGKTE